MAAVRDAGLTREIGVAPGPANGFTLDLIGCLERFGDEIDWAMIILNPLSRGPASWPSTPPRRRTARSSPAWSITAVFSGAISARGPLSASTTIVASARRVDRGRARANRPDGAGPRRDQAHADPARLPMEPRASGRRMRGAHPDPGGRARRAPDRGQAPGARWAPADLRLRLDQVAAIAAIGDNQGSMRLGARTRARGSGRAGSLEPQRRVDPAASGTAWSPSATCERRPSPRLALERADVRAACRACARAGPCQGRRSLPRRSPGFAAPARSSRSSPVSLEGADPRVSDHVVAAGEADAIARVRQHVVPA